MPYTVKQEICSGCHRCRMECPSEAIRFRNDKYWIDPEKCIDCGTCESVCHNGAIYNPDIPKETVESHDTIKMECDVCVIGAGAAGMVAATKAQDMGANVIVLEKNHEIGGSAWYATGFSVHYSKLHQEAGKPDTRSQTYEQFLEKLKGYDIDKELLKRLFEANADWIDWMIDEHNFRDLYDFNPRGFGPMCLKKKVAPPWNDKRIDNMIGPGGGGWLITTTLLKDFEAQGGKVFCNTPVKELITNEAGEVIGVIAEDAGGRIEISCKAAVVSSGAFTRNKEIMDKMQPLFYDDEGKQPVHIFTCSTCTGDGITMCEAIGADVDYKNRRVNLFGPMRHPYPAVTLNAGDGPMFRTTGERYRMGMGMNEVSDLAYDPKRYIWKIVDEATVRSNMELKIAQGMDDIGVDLSHFLKDWQKVLQEEAKAGSVVIADSLAELATKLNYDPVRFAADIDEYNRSLLASKQPPMMPPMGGNNGPVDMISMMPPMGGNDGHLDMMSMMPPMPDGFSGFPGGEMPSMGASEVPVDMMSMVPPMGGNDSLGDMSDLLAMMASMMGAPAQPIGKGPFYAIKMTLFHENSMGGMVIDKNAAVLKQGKPIPGLFAAGDTTRGVMVAGDIGVQYIEGVFTALTYAFNSGYISGVEAAKYALA